MKTDELRDMFQFEMDELLNSLDALLMGCEQRGVFSKEDVAEIFRTMHTLKGSCGMMKLTVLQTASHRLEDLFSFVRENPACLQGEAGRNVINTLYDFIKYMRGEIADYVEQDKSPTENAELLGQVQLLEMELHGGGFHAAAVENEKQQAAAQELANGPWEPARGHQLRVYFKDTPLLTVRTKVLAKAMDKLCEIYTTEPKNPDRRPELGAYLLEKGLLVRFILQSDVELSRVEEVLARQPFVRKWEVLQTPNPTAARQERAAAKESSNAQKMISIRRDKLNRHGDLLGELVTTFGALESRLQLLSIEDEKLERIVNQFAKIVNHLHKSGLEMNMVDMDTVFFRMRLISREMSSSLGKRVKLICEGGSTPVDKSVAEHLVDPLMHLVRNAMDHGIGTPEQRVQAGKPPEGVLLLRAAPDKDEIVVTVQDDGMGIDEERILASAEEKGLLTKPSADYTQSEIHQLLLLPGFSTKKDVSAYSGRGVGLDVVRETLRQMGGQLRLDSVAGQGCTFILSIPTNLAMVEVLEVEIGGTRAVLPVSGVRQIVAVNQVPTKQCGWVDKADTERVYRYDEEHFPILDIDARLHIKRKESVPFENYIFLRRRGGDVLVGVDQVIEIRTILIKSIPDYLKKMPDMDPVYSGCTISGDGRVSMVLDVNKL